MKINRPPESRHSLAMNQRLPRGIYPYLGATVSVDQLAEASASYGNVAVPGLVGASLALKAQATALIDPAAYDSATVKPEDVRQHDLWDFDEWLERQRVAGAPILLTDTRRIMRHDVSGLRAALCRWEDVCEPTLVVLPIEAWWLCDGLTCLIDEVAAAGRPVALVLLHPYNALDVTGSVAGLVKFVAAVGEIPVVIMRCDVSAVGAVAHGAHAGFAGMSASLRHGPLPIRRPRDAERNDRDRDLSPPVLVPALNDYHKAGKLPAIARACPDLLLCDCLYCQGDSLLEITRLYEVALSRAREAASRHNVAMHEQIALQVLESERPRDVWWQLCKAGADTTASLFEAQVDVVIKPWIRQWLDLGSPSHAPAPSR